MINTANRIQKIAQLEAAMKALLGLAKFVGSWGGRAAAKEALSVAAKTGIQGTAITVEHLAEPALANMTKILGAGTTSMIIPAKETIENAVSIAAKSIGTAAKTTLEGHAPEQIAGAAKAGAEKAVQQALSQLGAQTAVSEKELMAIAHKAAIEGAGVSPEIFEAAKATTGILTKQLSKDTATIMSNTLGEAVGKGMQLERLPIEIKNLLGRIRSNPGGAEAKDFIARGLNGKLNDVEYRIFAEFKKDLSIAFAVSPIEALRLAPKAQTAVFGGGLLLANQILVTSISQFKNGMSRITEDTKTVNGSVTELISRLRSLDPAGPAFEEKKAGLIAVLVETQSSLGNEYFLNQSSVENIMKNEQSAQRFIKHFQISRQAAQKLEAALREIISPEFKETYKLEAPETAATLLSKPAIGDITAIGGVQALATGCYDKLGKFVEGLNQFEQIVNNASNNAQEVVSSKQATVLGEFIKSSALLSAVSNNRKKKLNKKAQAQGVFLGMGPVGWAIQVLFLIPDIAGAASRTTSEVLGHLKNIQTTTSTFVTILNNLDGGKQWTAEKSILTKNIIAGLDILKNYKINESSEIFKFNKGQSPYQTYKQLNQLNIADPLKMVEEGIGATKTIIMAMDRVLSTEFEKIWDEDAATTIGAVGKWTDKYLTMFTEGGFSGYSILVRYAKIGKDQGAKLLLSLSNLKTQLSSLQTKATEMKKVSPEQIDDALKQFIANSS